MIKPSRPSDSPRWTARRARRVPYSAQTTTVFQLCDQESSARVTAAGAESRSRNAIEVEFLRAQAGALAVEDAEVELRDQISRDQHLQFFLLRRSEPIERKSALARQQRRMREASAVLLESYIALHNSLVEDAQPGFDELLHQFRIYRPVDDSSPFLRRDTPGRGARQSPVRRPATVPRPPTTFAGDQGNGRRLWARDKGTAAKWQSIHDAFNRCAAAEVSARRDVVKDELAELFVLQSMEMEGKTAAQLAMARRSANQASLDAMRARALQLNQAATDIQRISRGRAARLRSQLRRAEIEICLADDNARDHATVSTAVEMVQRCGRGFLARSAFSSAATELNAGVAAIASECATTALAFVTSDAGPPDTTTTAHTEPLGADPVSRNLSSRPVLAALTVLQRRGELASFSALSSVLGVIGESPVEAATATSLTPAFFPREAIADAVARCVQPPNRTGWCSPGMLAWFQVACERSSSRLAYCERVLGMNGVVTKTKEPAADPANTFPQHRGLALIMSAHDTGSPLMGLGFLNHAAWSDQRGLLNGRIDASALESRWRPYTSVGELFEEERQVIGRREIVDRQDLERHERNTFADVVRLHNALMEPCEQ